MKKGKEQSADFMLNLPTNCCRVQEVSTLWINLCMRVLRIMRESLVQKHYYREAAHKHVCMDMWCASTYACAYTCMYTTIHAHMHATYWVMWRVRSASVFSSNFKLNMYWEWMMLAVRVAIACVSHLWSASSFSKVTIDNDLQMQRKQWNNDYIWRETNLPLCKCTLVWQILSLWIRNTWESSKYVRRSKERDRERRELSEWNKTEENCHWTVLRVRASHEN